MEDFKKMKNDQNTPPDFNRVFRNLVIMFSILILILIIAGTTDLLRRDVPTDPDLITTNTKSVEETIQYWIAPEVSTITDSTLRAQVEYGRELIIHTAAYLGPNGKVLQISNGLNCQNCHLDAGTKVFGNNYGSVASLYPKFRARSGGIENVYKRVNDCFERSLNGKALDTSGNEMQAIVAYINFLGTNVEKGKKAEGSGLKDVAYLNRAADPQMGQAVYVAKCQSCHQANGEGLWADESKSEYSFPPLWGPNSFNDGAGLYRISNFARYVKNNMPQGATYLQPQLSDEEAWDVAAFVLNMPRPHIEVKKDWPDQSKKPFDHPFGPYVDTFPAKQHKFGPFQPILEQQKLREAATKQKAEKEKNSAAPKK